MHMPQHVAPVVGLIPAVLLAAIMTSCGAENTDSTVGGESSATSTGSSAAPSSAAPSAGVLVDARTVADQKNRTCSAPTTDTVTETLYSPVLTADGAVTISDTRAVGHGVELLDSDGASSRATRTTSAPACR